MKIDEFTKEQNELLVADLGFANASQEVKDKLLAQVEKMVDENLLFILVSRLSEEQIAEIEEELKQKGELAEGEKADLMLTLIEQKTENLDDFLAQAILEMYERIKQDMKTIKDYVGNGSAASKE
jgi:hypothetical protein